MKIKQASIFIALGLLSSSGAFAALSAITVSNLNTTVKDNVGNALSAGTAADGDGFVYQVGYFSTDTNSFSGSWVAITGDGSSNPSLVTTIGDLGGGPDGLISQEITFNDAIHASLPAGGAQLALRFYDATTQAAATHYNTVTKSTWTLNSFADSVGTPKALNLDEGGLTWQDGSNPFKTSLVVPEPSSVALLGLGGLAVLLRRRR